MKRNSTQTLLVIFGLLLFVFASAQTTIPNGGLFKIQGYVGHDPAHLPKEIMLADIPAKQVEKECTFFGGDSLTGFDFDAKSKESALHGIKMFREFKVYMFREQLTYVKNKYNISKLPREIAADKKRHAPPYLLTNACNNLDFESGNFTGWVGGTGYNPNSNAPLTVSGVATYTTNASINACDDFSLISSSYGVDPIGFFPGVDPNGGNYSLRLGGSYWNTGGTYGCNVNDPTFLGGSSNGEEISQTFSVTSSNALISFDCALILNDGSHLAGEQPYFHVDITDAGGTILNSCTQYSVQISGGTPPPGFILSGSATNTYGSNVYYQNWKSNSINLTPYIGQTVVVKFTAAGCTLGGHFCYAYIDASCGPAQIVSSNPTPCAGSVSTIILTAPATNGGTYSWSGPGIVGSTTGQTAVVNASGTYSVTLGGTCGYSLSTVVTFVSLSAAISSSAPATCVTAIGSATVSPSGGVPAYSYLWNTTPAQTTSSATGFSAGTYSVLVTDAAGCTGSASVTISAANGPTVTPTAANNVSCYGGNDGSSIATTTGGSPAYTYSWNNGQTTSVATGLSAGAYTVTVTDASSCSFKTTALITQPAALSNSFSVGTIACYGGSTGFATANPSGGTAPYSYSWNNGQTTQTATGLSAGDYTVTITDHKSCIKTSSVTFGQPTILTNTISSSANVSCYGGSNGSATVTASGGVAPYTYAWSNGQITQTATGFSATNYSVTVTDLKGCKQTATVSITQPATALTNTISASTVAGCTVANGTATASPSGGTPGYTYLWTPSAKTTQTATGLASGTTYSALVTDSKGCTKTSTVSISATASPSASVLTSAATCTTAIGSATVTPSGGTPGYTYSWSNGQTTTTATGFSAGTYSVLVTDAMGCTASSSVSIYAANGPTVTATATNNVSCNGGNDGSAVANVTGGNPAYTYSWNNGPSTSAITGLLSGSYTVTVTDANNCSFVTNALVTQPTVLAVTTSPINIACYGANNGSATANPSGGTSPYTYSWNNGQTTSTATGLSPTNYTVTTTDSKGCVKTVTVAITQPSAALTSSVSSTQTSCAISNGTATVNPTGGTSVYTYSWNNGQTTQTATGLGVGTYSVTVTDLNGCSSSNTISITQPPAITNTMSVTDASSCSTSDGSIIATVSGGTPNYTYAWNMGQTTSAATGLGQGTYTLHITDANNCATTFTATVNCATTTVELSLQNEFDIYPNPTSGIFNVQMSRNENVQIKIYNVLGEYIYQYIGTSANLHIDLSKEPNGIYFLQLKTNSGTATKKLVISK